MQTITPDTEGVFHALPASAYFSAPGVSQSMLKHLARSPAHLHNALTHPEEPTPAIIFGRIAHQLVLEPDAPAWWIVRPEGLDLRTTEGQAWKKTTRGKMILTSETWADLQGSVAAVRNHPFLSRILQEAQCEISLLKKISLGVHTILRRGRIDMAHESNTLLDLKFVEDAGQESFSRKIHALSYHVQAAYYLDLWNDCHEDKEQKKETFVFAAIENTAPYGVGIYNLNLRAIDLGRRKYLELLPLYARCQAEDNWPAYPREVQNIDLPRYAYMKKSNEFYPN